MFDTTYTNEYAGEYAADYVADYVGGTAVHPADLAVERLERAARRVSVAQAELYAAIQVVALAASDTPGTIDEFAADEVRAALAWTRRAADLHVNLAWQLVERLPAVWEALAAGDIDLARARVIISETSCLDEDAARNVADQILVGAGGRTTGQLRARLRRMVITVDPAAAQTRYENAVADRSVTLAANDDGTANMTAWNLPAARAQAAMRRVVATARAAKTADDPRTTDQTRADTFLDLLDGTSNSASRGRRAGVDISVDLTTLLDLDEQPGEIGGYGPVIADVARQVLKDQIDAEWRVAVTDPDTGDIIWHGTTRRRPTAAQARDVRLRKRTCVFPGCRMPAADSDLDHTLDWARDGQTHRDNLAPLCRHDHRLKHKGGWSVTRLPDDTYQWTSRLGRTYFTDPRVP